jgi:hypothetical protein
MEIISSATPDSNIGGVNFHSSIPKSQCTWSGCGESVTSQALTDHLSTHALDVLKVLAYPSRCLWQGCKSKASFKTKTSYKDHLTNIHTHPLTCTEYRCSYKKPFRNDGDLGRHKNTVHSSQRKYECPYDSCNAEITNFARRDKWLKHIRETQHFQDAFCPFHHCQLEFGVDSKGFTSRQAISTHFSRYHAENRTACYDCGLGSCGLNPHCD